MHIEFRHLLLLACRQSPYTCSTDTAKCGLSCDCYSSR